MKPVESVPFRAYHAMRQRQEQAEQRAALEQIDKSLTALLWERTIDSTRPEWYVIRDARDAARKALGKSSA